jgi:CRP/FNR family transcriptional regulator, cyclic AMP receptor protein
MASPVTVEQLQSTPMFDGLDPGLLERIAAEMQAQSVPLGTVFASEGDLPTKFFVVLDGWVTVHRHGHHVADLGPGQVFGETGAVTLQPRNASVIATTPVRIASMMGWELRTLLEESPEVHERIDALVAERGSG